MGTRIAALIAAVAVLMLAGAVIAAARTPQATPAPRVVHCGVERWKAKTLSDRRRFWVHLRRIHPTTVRALRQKPAPRTTGEHTPRRRGVETTVHRVRARLVEYKLEDDSDIHLVIRRLSGPGTMIVEFPYRGCMPLVRVLAAR
jgi:hypothetical protein